MSQNLNPVYHAIKNQSVAKPSFAHIPAFIKSKLYNSDEKAIEELAQQCFYVKSKLEPRQSHAMNLIYLTGFFLVAGVFGALNSQYATEWAFFSAISGFAFVLLVICYLMFVSKIDQYNQLSFLVTRYHHVNWNNDKVPTPAQIKFYCEQSEAADIWRRDALKLRPFLTVGDAITIEVIGLYHVTNAYGGELECIYNPDALTTT